MKITLFSINPSYFQKSLINLKISILQLHKTALISDVSHKIELDKWETIQLANIGFNSLRRALLEQ